MKTRYSISIDIKTLELAKQLAKQHNRPVSNLIEWLIQQEAEKELTR